MGRGVSWTEPASSEVGCSKPAALLDFLSPFQVVRPGFLSSHALDEILQVLPETELLQRVVQPTCRETSPVTVKTLGTSRFSPGGDRDPPVVMQKYVSCGETWWMRWCLRGRMMCQSCRSTTQRGRPKYVCDHLWIWLVSVTKMASANK